MGLFSFALLAPVFATGILVAAPRHLVCERDGCRSVVGVPAQDCAFWMRPTGADDE